MKTSIFLISCVFLFLVAGAQFTEKINGLKKISDITRLDNGKYVYNIAICHDTGARMVLKHSGNSLDPAQFGMKNNLKTNPIIVRHIVFHFDKHPICMLCNGTDTAFTDRGNMNWINNLTLEAWMPDGFYDLMNIFDENNGLNHEYVFVKNFHVYKDLDTTILSTSANYQVDLRSYDENNNFLTDDGLEGNSLGVIIEFPPGYIFQIGTSSYAGNPTDHVRFSMVTPDFKIYIGETHVKKDQQWHRYEISYPPLMGITQDTSLANNPGDYRQYPLVFYPSPAFNEEYFVFGYGWFANTLLTQPDYFMIYFGCFHYPSTPIDTIRLFTTDIINDTNKYCFASGISHWECNPGLSAGLFKDIYSWLYYVTPGNNLVLSGSGQYPPLPGDYQIPEGYKCDIGNDTPFDHAWSYNSSIGYQIHIWSIFTGQANELRNIDQALGTYDIWEEYQLVYHDSIKNNPIFWGASGPWNYTVVMNDSNYSLCGKPGYLQAKFAFNIGNSDANPPRLNSMQIKMGDSIKTNIIHGFPATVNFTAGDWIAIPNQYWMEFQQVKEVHLKYKNFFETNWQELEVQPQPANLDSLFGMPYLADLEQVLNQYPDSAFIDLKIELIDSAGNSNIQTIHPAFLVRDAMTEVNPVHKDPSVLIYPDPAADKIHFSTGEDPVAITIYASTGRPVLEINSSKEIDVSGLNPGLYMVRIKNTITGKTSFGKFIR